ncbi:MAG: hypothetical protein PHU49_00380 [Syntrophorhabdaceae bacterium]|nr:hypothetical protein [Syntrophorhabdaceae bacterium]
MKRLAIFLVVIVLLGCANTGLVSRHSEGQIKEYSATSITLSDFSKKIIGHYQLQNMPVPNNFDANQFFSLLEKIYPDQPRVQSVKNNYKVSARPLNGGYSVMLCDPKTDAKIMEDLSCHLTHVEIRSWENNTDIQCAFENNWKPLCK